MLGKLSEDPSANIIKLPNISASIPQLKAAIRELQDKGYNIPDFPDDPATDEERDARARYSKVIGSAVNPVLRQGNSDRRSSNSVKEHGKRNPHRMMRDWPEVSKTRVTYMTGGDFYGSERAVTITAPGSASIEYVSDGQTTALKSGIPLVAGEIIDCAVMNVRELRKFYAEQIDKAKTDEELLSLHLEDYHDEGGRSNHFRPLRIGLL